MNIELRKIKYAAFASQETACFAAEIWIDGQKAGDVENDGHGGSDMIHPQACAQRLEQHCKTLPETDCSDLYKDGQKHTMPMSPEILIGDLLNAYLAERDVKRKLARHLLWIKAGEPGIWQSRAYRKDELARFLRDPALTTKLEADKVLNLLPLPEAVTIYRARAR